LLFGEPGGRYKVVFLVNDNEVRVVSVIHAAHDQSVDDVDPDDLG